MRALAVVVCLAACGRIGFDARDGNIGGDGGGTADGGVFVGTTATYVKASNTGVNDLFGAAIALSADGTTLAVGAFGEASNSANGEQGNNAAPEAGAVYIYVRGSGGWSQQAYIKASVPQSTDVFGGAIALSADGNTLVVGALGEDSDTTGVNPPINNQGADGGAAYVYRRNGTTWQLEAFLKASNTGDGDVFGTSVAMSADGNTVVVGAPGEDSAATGINGSQGDDPAIDAGAAYVYRRAGTTWTHEAYVKASNTSAGDFFGDLVAISADGSTFAVGAYFEASPEVGINATGQLDTAVGAGAVYVFVDGAAGWEQQAYVKSSNTNAGDQFGVSAALSADGRTMVVGAHLEDSNARGVNGNASDDSSTQAGAAYVLERTGDAWAHTAYIKPSNTANDYNFGLRVAVAHAGDQFVVGASNEASASGGVGADPLDVSMFGAGAAYVFGRSGTTWAQRAYVKATVPGPFDNTCTVAMSGNGRVLALGGYQEDSAATGIDGNANDDSAMNSGAVYVYE